MLVVVEGPDESGKSTLVKEIVDELDQRGYSAKPRLSYGKPWDLVHRTFRELADHVYSLTEPVPEVQVVDRFYFSEIFYSKAQGRKVSFSHRQRGTIEVMLMRLGIPIIVCMPPDDVLNDNWEKRSDNKVGLTELERQDVIREYKSLIANPPLNFNIVKYDYTATLDIGSYYIDELESGYLKKEIY